MISPFAPDLGQQQNVFTDNSHACVLMIFQPNRVHRFGMQAHRPLLYSFTDQFNDAAARVADQVARGGHVSCIDQLISDGAAHGSVKPSSDPSTLIDMNPLVDFYRFTMVINKPTFNGIGPSPFSPEQAHKVLICGYFLDEPVNPHNPSTFNPDAQMVITHKTVMETTSSFGTYGPAMESARLRMDANITNQGVTQLSTNPDLYYTDPYMSFTSNFIGGDGNLVTNPGHLQSVGGTENRLLQTKLQHPTANLRHVLTSVYNAQREVFDGQQSGGILRNDAAMAMPIFARDGIYDGISRNLRAQSSTADAIGPNVHDVWTMARVEAEFPSTEVVLVEADQVSTFDSQDQTMTTPRTIYSSLICSAAPAILSAFGLARLGFVYESYADNPLSASPYAYKVEHVVPMVQFPGGSETIKMRAEGAINEFIRTIFSVMQQTRGDFKVHIDFDIYGMSQVYLNFNCDSLIISEPYQHLTSFGGIVAPMFGNAGDIAHNGSELACLINAMGQDSIAAPSLPVPAVQPQYTAPQPQAPFPNQDSGFVAL